MKNLFKRKKAVAFYKGEEVKDIFTQKFDGEAKIETFVTEPPISFQAIPENLSKREYFAGLAMQGILGGAFKSNDGWIVEKAISIADLLIKTLDGTINEPKIKVVYTYENKYSTEFVSARYFNETEMWKKDNIISIEVL